MRLFQRRRHLAPLPQTPLPMRPIVDYHLMREALPIPPSTNGQAYDYLFGSDGVFMAARNDLLYARVPVAACDIRGLLPVGAECALVHGKVPGQLWDDMLTIFDGARYQGCEAMVAIAHDTGCGYQLVLPDQEAKAWSVNYAPRDGWLLEVHSHREAAARFSLTDTNDEQGFRLYGVVGRLDQPVPQVHIRCGLYGHFMPVPWYVLFDGNVNAVNDVNDEFSLLARL